MCSFEILIPAYNAEKELPELINRCLNLSAKPQRIIVVNDGSNDRTAAVMANLPVEAIHFPTNSGKGAALQAGIKLFLQKNARYLITLDADNQHDPSLIPAMVRAAVYNQWDIVIGRRQINISEMPLARVYSNRTTSTIVSFVAGQMIRDSQSGFRLFHRRVLETCRLTESGFQLETEILLKAARQNYRIGEVDIPTIYGREKSHIRHFSDTFHFVRVVIQFVLGWI